MLNHKPHIAYISQVPKLNSGAFAFDICVVLLMGFFKNKKMFWKQHVNLDCKCKFE
jgi:hypothetical protein